MIKQEKEKKDSMRDADIIQHVGKCAVCTVKEARNPSLHSGPSLFVFFLFLHII